MGDLSRPEVEDPEDEVLEEVAQVLSHDLSNILTTARSSLELARRSSDEEHFDRTTAILENSDELVDNLVTLARTGRQFDEVVATDLEEAAENAWFSVVESGASLRVDSTARLLANPGGLRQLLENLFQNAVEHGSTTPDSASPRQDAVEHGSTSPASQAQQDAVEHGASDVTVEVGTLQRDETEGFYVADDGDGFALSDPDRAFESGYSTVGEQSGLGLAIVERIADAHGWRVSATESRAGGARVEVVGVETDSTGREADRVK